MAEEKKGKKEEADANTGVTPFSVKFSIFMLLVTAGVFLPTTIVFMVCLVPTWIAAITDNNPHKTLWLTVGAMNIAGTIPVWLTLFDSGHTIASAFQLVMDARSIMISFGGAAVGWLIHCYVTPMIAVIVQSKNERRLQEIARRQQELVRKWGENVVHK